jgi:polyisoprenoid-binding protein YceI
MRHLATFVLSALLLSATSVAAGEYSVNFESNKDTVYFRSTAKLEFIQGETSDLTGGFKFDIENPSGPVSGVLRVDLRTLKTGIETRDEHMRDRHLHTEEYPFAYFQLTDAAEMPTSFKADSVYETTGNGYFYIHGVKRRLSTDLRLELAGDRLEVRANFQIQLDDYGIPRPKALFLKLAETVEVEVILSGYNNLPAMSVALPDWPEAD